MIPLFNAATVFDLGQAGLQLNAIHTALPKPLSNQFYFQSAGGYAAAKVLTASSLRRIT